MSFKLYCSYFSLIYNTRNQSNDTAESQKEKRPDLMFILSTVSQNHGTKKNLVIENLAMLKCESRTKLHAVQYKCQPGLFLLF